MIYGYTRRFFGGKPVFSMKSLYEGLAVDEMVFLIRFEETPKLRVNVGEYNRRWISVYTVPLLTTRIEK